MQHTEIDKVLTFWIDEIGPDGWYKGSDELDTLIRREFGGLHALAANGMLNGWSATPRGALALIILLDQFSRNMFRGTSKAFAYDRLALTIAKRVIDQGHDRATPEPERQFFYLPLEHSESLQDQERAVRLFMMRMPDMTDEGRRAVIGHRAVIRRFGRFPSRNAALGRTDSDAELAYRAEGGYMG